jgi:hypothetical protein
LGLVVLTALALMVGHFAAIWWWGFKLWTVVIGAAIGLAGRALKLAMKTRREPFCIHCGYSLRGLPDHHICPECGRPFSFELIEEYRQDPVWFVERWKTHRESGRAESAPFEAGAHRRRRSRDGT